MSILVKYGERIFLSGYVCWEWGHYGHLLSCSRLLPSLPTNQRRGLIIQSTLSKRLARPVTVKVI